MSGLGALWYADRRAFVHGLRRGIRSPGRIAIWTGYAVLLGVLFWSRVFVTRGHVRASALQFDAVRADFFICALLAALALALASGRGPIGIFRTRVEARFIIGSPVAAPLAIAYLQAREALAVGPRRLFSFTYFLFLLGPRGIGPLTVLADLVLLLAMVAAANAVIVPRRLASRAGGIACGAAGVPLALLAVAPILRDAVMHSPVELPGPFVTAVAAVIPAWHPGRVLLEPNPIWLLAVLALAAAAIAVLAPAGRDAYPELYALAVARIDRLERWRQRRVRPALSAAVRQRRRPAIPAPAGVLVLVWKSGVEFVRRTRPPYIIGVAVLWGVAGFTAARFVAAAAGESALFRTLVGVTTNILLVVGIGATSEIAAEVRRPLFWLAPAGLFERLCALALARIWRTIATLEIVAASFAVGGGTRIETLIIAIGLPALVALLAGAGFAAYAPFPKYGGSARAGRAMPRLLVSVVLLVPPLALVIAATVFDAALLGLALATLVALIEAAALIGIAAWRLDGRIDRLPV